MEYGCLVKVKCTDSGLGIAIGARAGRVEFPIVYFIPLFNINRTGCGLRITVGTSASGGLFAIIPGPFSRLSVTIGASAHRGAMTICKSRLSET